VYWVRALSFAEWSTLRFCRVNAETPPVWGWGFCLLLGSLTITYFHTGIRTIIGVESFHGPVRDGKGWYRHAMVIRHDLLSYCSWSSTTNREEVAGRMPLVLFGLCCFWHNTDHSTVRGVRTPFGGGVRVSAEALTLTDTRHTCYRIKPYGQLVSVSLTHYCASTPDLSTSWS
jgi:hypothetical protein